MKLSNAGESSRRSSVNIGSRFEAIGSLVLRYGLVLVIGWIGLMKFTAYEANGIQPLVAHSPFLSWMYGLLTVEQFSKGLGTVEVIIAVLIGLRHWSAKASALGSGLAVIMFLTTLSFSDDTLVCVLDAGMGAKPRWLSCALWIGGPIPGERRRVARRVDMDSRRSVDSPGPGCCCVVRAARPAQGHDGSK